MDMPVIDHRSLQFRRARQGDIRRLPENLPDRPRHHFPSSGTGAWEAAIVNTLSPGDKVLMVETAISPRCGGQMARRAGASMSISCRATGATAPIPLLSRPGWPRI
jgi:alanine-glyoxylate transaminase/serine-glyoxylate transaminase/serine-pyruvate transaminase